MSDLTHFLLERIDEDERHARKLAEADRRPVLSLASTVNHPGRILLECEAKRQIVEHCKHGDWTDPMEGTSETLRSLLLEENARDGDVLALLALPYADHPDYDASWRP
jgi:hypothetical protein